MGRATRLLTQSVIVQNKVGQKKKGGDPIYGDRVVIRCRVEFGVKLIRTPDGNEIQTEATIVTEEPIERTARLWLPGADLSDDDESKRVAFNKQAQTPGGYALYETFV